MLLTMLLAGCQSTRTEYVEKTVVPPLSFPVFPLLQDGEAVRNKEAGTVTVPEEWIVRLRVYQIEIEKTEKNYNGLKALYEGKEIEK